MPPPVKVRLGDLLIQQGLLSAEQLTLALEEQRRTGRKLGRVFVEGGYVSEAQISEALARQLNIPYVNLRHHSPKPELIKLLPEAAARRFRAVVLDQGADGRLRVGMSDPADLQAYDEIVRILRRDIDLVSVTESQLLELIDNIYHHSDQISGLAKELTAELGEVPVEFGNLLGLTPGAEDAPVVRLLHTVFDEALRLRASDVHVEPQESCLRIRFRIDGVLHVQTEADSKIAAAVALRLKLMSGLDISEKRLPQDGRFAFNVRGRPVDVRISTLPTQYGESVVMRLLNQNTGLLSIDKIGMSERVLTSMRQALKRPSGMVLVTGPTGSGKTTTLYAAMNELNDPGKKVITVEDPVEYRLPGLNQVQVHEKIDLSFSRVLRTVLRQDPDIVLIGEMRDQETAEIGMRAAMTGHLVLSTLHTNDALSTPIRLLDMGVPRYMVALSVHLVVAQRLVRMICEHCREPYEPTPAEHEWLQLELREGLARGALQHGRGCMHCKDCGYQGRTGVYEVLEMTERVVEAINHGDPGTFMQVARQQMAGETLRRDAVRLALEGVTTVAEAMRISNQIED
ncbi:MAG: Flp pilus assembly complex ATPase component TadA [Paucibacter sp.]|nr:Flp pilus assembly complex ATPase component TadA [Roseateles sp.]